MQFDKKATDKVVNQNTFFPAIEFLISPFLLESHPAYS